MSNHAEIIIDAPSRDTIDIVVFVDGAEQARRQVVYEGAVDTKLLTVVDNMFNEHILDKFASLSVKPGPGIDKTSLLYRIVITLGAALERTT